jgi:hypothetical protein
LLLLLLLLLQYAFPESTHAVDVFLVQLGSRFLLSGWAANSFRP